VNSLAIVDRRVYLGKGLLVVTTAHVVGWAAGTKPSVRIASIAGLRVDLTLLSIDEQKLPIRLGIRRISCEKSPMARGDSLSRFQERCDRNIMSPQVPFEIRRKFGGVQRFAAIREFSHLEALWASGSPPWKRW